MSGRGSTGVLVSELTKIRTVRSTTWTLLLTFLLSVAISLALAVFMRGAFDRISPAERDSFDPAEFALGTVAYGQVVLVAFAVLVVSSEYGSGTIRASLAAVPLRGRFYGTKILAGGLLAFVVAELTAFAMFFVSQVALGEHGGSLGDPGVLRAVFGTGVYLTLIALFSTGVATVLRSSALALGVLIPFFFIVSNLLGHVPGIKRVGQFLPDQAGHQIMLVTTQTDSVLGPWTGLLVQAAWAAAALAGGYLALRSRDA
ncbi:ABC transporter permease [Actinokineospora sp. NBRC 105648]|uniref:ABC transporter permease subunit n=1 Tax=Actinokineospora sp. NBRC 105648 TaxID=3032206 RepID=UPI0024A17F5B|nr:ABC transporter permease [Actinokineospora sp. NBRC 105648]GLZ37028.1 ABC transporter [Actinokineospora sp. NBRC 105648]